MTAIDYTELDRYMTPVTEAQRNEADALLARILADAPEGTMGRILAPATRNLVFHPTSRYGDAAGALRDLRDSIARIGKPAEAIYGDTDDYATYHDVYGPGGMVEG